MTARLSRRAVCGAALAALVGGALALPALAAKDDLDLVTRATGVAGAPAVASSFEATLSADGRLVAFQSGADNLSTEDDNDFTNVFVRDLQANTTTLVSRASGATGAAGDAVSAGAEISADGRFVAFHSAADNLSTEDGDDFIDVFVRDLQAGTTTLVSRATGPAGDAGDDDSTQATISADGRLVAFESQADNLSGDDVNIVTDVFVRDLLTGTTTLVSRESGPGGAGGLSASLQPTISADGRVVAFHSDADNLSAEDDAAALDVFVRDLPASTTTLVSRADGPTGAGGGDGSSGASISADGRRIAFSSFADNLSTEDDNDLTNVFVRDRLAGTTALASRAAGPAGAGADGDSGTGARAFSADGRLLAFASIANNLSAEDVDAVSDVFVRDLQAQIVTLVSRAAGPAGAAGSDGSGDAAISADGRFVAFQSLADNLAADDDNAFVEHLPPRRARAAAPARRAASSRRGASRCGRRGALRRPEGHDRRHRAPRRAPRDRPPRRDRGPGRQRRRAGAGRSRPDLPRRRDRPRHRRRGRRPRPRPARRRPPGGRPRPRPPRGRARPRPAAGRRGHRPPARPGRPRHRARRPRRRRLPGRDAPRLLSQASVRGAPLD